ncbi:MAG: hypothetical protein J2O39_05735 [Acidimicrobiales bacterium]|nr:hypothetical protein [Acidimicrobiales bacterium]
MFAPGNDKEPLAGDSAVGTFKELLSAVAAQQTTSITAPVLQKVIEDAPDGEAVQRLVAHLSMTTSLTDTTARPLAMQALLDHPGDPAGAAEALSSEAATVIGGLELELSQPASMLSDRLRLLLTWVGLSMAGACVVAITLGSAFSGGFSGGTSGGLAGIGIASLLFVLLLAIGYKSVTIKVGSGGGAR